MWTFPEAAGGKKEGIGMKIKEIKAKALTLELFRDFNRYQEVTKCWRKEEGRWILKDIAFTEQWEQKDYEKLIEGMKGTIDHKGRIYGAFENEKLLGFCSIEHERFGSNKQYVELSEFYVSHEERGKGVGKKLFETACSVAASFGAKKLYISAHSSQETQAFYKTMGCKEAEEYNQKSVEKEPCDCQLECETGYRQSNYMTMGMCLGMCFGAALGILVFDNVGVGMCLGMVIGMGLGIYKGGTKDGN